jgi:ubiquitin carboxyl-terminal hydrolase 34
VLGDGLVQLLTHTDLVIPSELLPALAAWLNGLPDDVSGHLQSFFVNRAQFWGDFADLVEKLLKRRYQWMTALEASKDDDMSRYPMGETYGDDAAVEEAFSLFFSAYLRLCSQLISFDIHLLNRERLGGSYALPLICERHLCNSLSILRTEAPVFHLLRRHHDLDIRDLSHRLHTDFLEANGSQNILRLADELYHSVPSTLQDQVALCICQILSALGWTICRLPDSRGGVDPEEFYRGTLLFFQKYARDLEDPAKVTDTGITRALIACFSVMVQELGQWDEKYSESLANEHLNSNQRSSPSDSSPVDAPVDSVADYRKYSDYLPVVVANTWKFNLLRRYIVKGKMELRLMSIGLMDDSLIKLYDEYNGVDTVEKHPVLNHVADVLLRGRVVDYILSVDSHPQLLSRSGNVLGFLLVTNRWTDSQADAIWNIVSSSPDPRMVAATMAMLRQITNFMKPTHDLYFCMKLYELPIASYTSDVLSFLRTLSGKLLDRRAIVDWDSRSENARPWNVCVRLLQHTAPRHGVTKHELDTSIEAEDQLYHIARCIPELDQQSIYGRCLEEIVARSDKATGSVRVIFILGTALKSHFLHQDIDMTPQIVEELSSFVESESKTTSHEQQLPALQYRLDLLRLLVCERGRAIPQELYITVWDHIVGPQALSNDARDAAWTELCQATRIVPENNFCRQLISTYVPAMDPSYFTPGLYSFIASYKFPLSRKTVQIDGMEHLLLQIPGSDLLWSLALSSPPGTIEEKAAHDLAVRYTQIPQSTEILLSDVETAHVELVERCMTELRSAFEALHKTPSPDRQVSELRFSRVLMFLIKMLGLVRQKAEFNRGRRADSKVDSIDMSSPPDNAITIRYQVGNDRRSLQIPSDRTIADLHHTICQATKTSKINLFAGGQKLDVTGRADQKLADAHIGGQLLVQILQWDETARKISAPVAGCSEFEMNLVKHFDEMFAWLDVDDAPNQLVSIFNMNLTLSLADNRSSSIS